MKKNLMRSSHCGWSWILAAAHFELFQNPKHITFDKRVLPQTQESGGTNAETKTFILKLDAALAGLGPVTEELKKAR